MADKEGAQKTQTNLQAARLGLSLLGSLQQQGRNARPNPDFGFSVSSPKFSFSAQRRPPEDDFLKATIEQLGEIDKQREKVFKEQEALDAALGKNEIGKTLLESGLKPEVQIGEDIKSVFSIPKKPFADQLAQSLSQQFGFGSSGGQAPQTVNDPVTAQTPGAVPLPGGGFGVPQGNTGSRGLARKSLSGGGVNVIDLDTEAAIKAIQNLSPEKASDTEKKDLANLVNSISSMDGLANLIQTNKEQFEEQLGPLKISNFQGGLGELARKVKGDPILSTLALETETTFQQVRSAITGAQASARELEILRPLTPQMTDPINIFIAKTMAFRRIASRSFQNKLNVLKATGVDTKALDQFNKETLEISAAEYKIQLIENGVKPEQANKLVESFSEDVQSEIDQGQDFFDLAKKKGIKVIA